MLASTVQELLVVFRSEVHDDKLYSVGDDDGCLWKDVEIIRYINEACDALAIRTRGLIEVIEIDFDADDTTVPLPVRVLHINEARLQSDDSCISVTNSNVYYRLRACTGRPYEVYRDYDRERLRLYPTPTEADTLELSCSVSLEEALVDTDDLPFVRAADQRLLLEYMKMLAYRKQDAETEDLVRSRAAEEAYNRGAADRVSEIMNQRRAPGLIQMDW